jgi:paraquat-inducible protein A
VSDRAAPAVLVACHDCGRVHRVAGLADGATAECGRCRGVLLRRREAGIERALALNVAALLLFGVANLFPLMTLRMAGQEQATTLLGGVTALHRAGLWELAGLVLLVAVVFPLLKLAGSAWVLALARAGRLTRAQAPVFRLMGLLRPWSMTEVYLLGLVVAWVKLRDLATIELGAALFALVGLILLMLWAEAALEPHEVWERVLPQAREQPGEDPNRAPLLACHACAQLVRPQDLPEAEHARCPRCGAALHRRKPESLARTWALLIAATILYVPANLLPIMTVVSLGSGEADTILSGVKALIAAGMWPVALLVFFASITVPVLKVVGLVYLLVATRRGSTARRLDRTRMYRVIEAVGRWSMVDIFMIAILVGLVSLGELATIEPGTGAVAFAAVVILTMLASHAFDPRLMWDAGETRDDGRPETRA